MKNITIETTVGDVVRSSPARSRLFEQLGIDYCCGGKKPLAEACRGKGLDPATVVAMLTVLERGSNGDRVDPDAMSLSELCDHIEKVHHGYLRDELPRLDFMTRKVAAVHGDHEPRLREVRRVFEIFATAISGHTEEEDKVVFPAIRELEAGGGATEAASLKEQLAELEQEHDKAGGALAQFKALTDGYTPPEWACNTFRALYDALARLEEDMHQHVHKENNILFPKALARA